MGCLVEVRPHDEVPLVVGVWKLGSVLVKPVFEIFDEAIVGYGEDGSGKVVCIGVIEVFAVVICWRDDASAELQSLIVD